MCFHKSNDALNYLHTTCGIVHRNVRLWTILLSSDVQATLTDFEYAAPITDYKEMNTKTKNMKVLDFLWDEGAVDVEELEAFFRSPSKSIGYVLQDADVTTSPNVDYFALGATLWKSFFADPTLDVTSLDYDSNTGQRRFPRQLFTKTGKRDAFFHNTM